MAQNLKKKNLPPALLKREKGKKFLLKTLKFEISICTKNQPPRFAIVSLKTKETKIPHFLLFCLTSPIPEIKRSQEHFQQKRKRNFTLTVFVIYRLVSVVTFRHRRLMRLFLSQSQTLALKNHSFSKKKDIAFALIFSTSQ